MPVLNSLAARTLAKAGFEGVTLSVEGDRRQFEEVTAFCPLPASLYVFGRPLLVVSRQALERQIESLLADRPDQRFIPRRESGLWCCDPTNPSTCAAWKTSAFASSISSWTWSVLPTRSTNGSMRRDAVNRPFSSITSAAGVKVSGPARITAIKSHYMIRGNDRGGPRTPLDRIH